jgi:hypothetical protein
LSYAQQKQSLQVSDLYIDANLFVKALHRVVWIRLNLRRFEFKGREIKFR